MINRQKSYIGNGMIEDQINKFLSPANSFEDFVEKSQVQSMALNFALNAHINKQPLHGHYFGSLTIAGLAHLGVLLIIIKDLRKDIIL